MTGSKLLLDTNIISALTRGEAIILQNIRKASSVYTSVISIGELNYGAQFSQDPKKHLAQIKNLRKVIKVLLVDEESSLEYGKIKAALRRRGTPIPENDIWIAAIAIRHKLPVVTRDNDFNYIAGLKTIKW